VVIPTFDRPDLAVDAVRSVDDQTVDDLEVLVVDDHSPRPVRPRLEAQSFDSVTVRCFRHEENRGANAARNTGIRAAQGDFVAFLDDDDRWKPTFVERLLDRFRSVDDDVGVVHAGLEIVDEDGDLVGTDLPTARGEVTRDILTGTRIGSFSRLMVRRSAIETAGLPDDRYPSWQDLEWMLRLSRHCRFDHVAETLVVRRVGHGQISDDYREKRDVTYPMFVSQYRPLAATYGPPTERRFVAATTTMLASCAVRNGVYEDAVQYALWSIGHYPFDPAAFVFLIVSLGGDLTYKSASTIKARLAPYVQNI
jgi:glycosyltransferase involved in cell wall biosynthesis